MTDEEENKLDDTINRFIKADAGQAKTEDADPSGRVTPDAEDIRKYLDALPEDERGRLQLKARQDVLSEVQHHDVGLGDQRARGGQALGRLQV